MPPWLRYTLIRIVVFAIPLALLLFLGVFWLWAAVVASVVSLCVSFIFLGRSRGALAEEWASRRPTRTRDDVDEDEELDRASGAAAGSSGAPHSAEAAAPTDAEARTSAERERRAES